MYCILVCWGPVQERTVFLEGHWSTVILPPRGDQHSSLLNTGNEAWKQPQILYHLKPWFLAGITKELGRTWAGIEIRQIGLNSPLGMAAKSHMEEGDLGNWLERLACVILLVQGVAAVQSQSKYLQGLRNPYCPNYPLDPIQPLVVGQLGQDWSWWQESFDTQVQCSVLGQLGIKSPWAI